MAGRIAMDPENLRTKAKKFGDSGDDIRTMLSMLTNLTDELADEWQGAAYEGYRSKFDEIKPNINKFADLMDDVNKKLNDTADALVEQDQQLGQGWN